MSAESPDKIAGQSIFMVRRLLVEGIDEAWNEWLVKYVLGVDPATAEQIIWELADRGYIERAWSLPGEVLWESTIAGQVLAQVTKIWPMPRARAERKLRELEAKVETVREDASYLYRVKQADVFGQFLTTDEAISELNVAVTLVPKDGDARRQIRLEEQRIVEAKRQGISFAGRAEELKWPQKEVITFLESQSRILKVVTHEEVDFKAGHMTLYKEE